jgi:large subunit ribosomal protein L18
MCVFRSHKHISCQLIDDSAGRTLVAVGTLDKDLADQVTYGGNREAAQVIGQTVAQRALEAGIQAVRFDRGAYKYHGRVAALADAAREAGLTL